MLWLLALPIGYLLGSIPTSIIVGKLFFGKDIRAYGSGNAGASNAFRVFGGPAGLGVVAGDIGKGAAAVLIGGLLPAPEAVGPAVVAFAAGAAAVVGHIWTVFARFKGGKGVATAGGVLLALYPVSFAGAFLVFLAALVLSGYTSLGSILAALSFPLIMAGVVATGIHEVPPFLRYLSVPLALLILFTHRSNFGRLMRGEENRFERVMIFRRRGR
ncbi:MAG: glycerol-3-phosphate 1-O-acyltransferase PlsY [Spirochaetaceae bacterium]